MQEIVTNSFVLDSTSFSNRDRRVDLFTEKLGRIKATVVSGAKMKSKLSPHLDVFNLVVVRLFEKNRFTVTDVLTQERFESIREDVDLFGKALSILFLVKNICPENVPDKQLWQTFLSSIDSKDLNPAAFMEILGYSPEHSSCFKCNNKNSNYFFVPDQLFVCGSCSKKIPSEFLIKTQ